MSNPLTVIKPNLDDKLYGAQTFDVEEFRVRLFVNRVVDKKLVKKYSQEYGLAPDPPAKQTIRKFGLKLELSFEGVSLFRNDAFPLSAGSKRWCFNIRRPKDKVSILYAVSLEVNKAENPVEISFKANARIDAALAVYEQAIDRAKIELRRELQRIYMIEETVPTKPKAKKLLRKA